MTGGIVLLRPFFAARRIVKCLSQGITEKGIRVPSTCNCKPPLQGGNAAAINLVRLQDSREEEDTRLCRGMPRNWPYRAIPLRPQSRAFEGVFGNLLRSLGLIRS